MHLPVSSDPPLSSSDPSDARFAPDLSSSDDDDSPVSLPPTLVLGDANVSRLQLPGCRMVGLTNGRLSGLLSYARTQLRSSTEVNKVFLCLSTLDRRNKLITLTTTLKSLLSKCHCLFPRAALFVLLSGVPSHFSSSERETFHQFSAFVRNKHPSQCVVFSAPSPFLCSGDKWSSSVRGAVQSKISNHLN